MKKYVIAIDQGTTSTRAILFDKNQQIVKVAQKEFTNYFPHPGWVEQDALEIWQSTLDVINELFESNEYKPEDVESIGITNQRETTILWDKTTGKPVYHAIVWQSRQTDKVIERYKQQGKEEFVRSKTGLLLDPYFSASKIRWIYENVEGVEDNPNILFGTIDTWLTWMFSKGKYHITDVTNASRTLLFNIHSLNWDKELLDLFEIPEYILPTIVSTSGHLAKVDPSCFFGQDIEICSLVGDQQSALFGQSCFDKGSCKNTYGTGGFLLYNTGTEPIISKNGLLTTVAWKIGDNVKYALEGSILVSGSLIQWLRDGLKIIKTAGETEEIAKSVESSNGVYIVPAFTGLGAPCWNANARGSIFGLTRGVETKHLVRAAIESQCYQSKDLIEIIEEEVGQKINNLKVDGGASANKFLLQFQADILEAPVLKNSFAEMTALGAARLAGLTTGFYSKEDFLKENITEYKPSMEHEKVDELYSKWKKAVKACQEY